MLARGLLVVAGLTRIGAGRAVRAPLILDVSIKSRLAPGSPITAFVVTDLGARTHKAEEHVPRWANHNSRVPVPYDYIAWLRIGNAAKAFDPVIQIVGGRISIGEAGFFVDGVNQMRTIVTGVPAEFGIESGRDHGKAVVGSDGWLRFHPSIPARV